MMGQERPLPPAMTKPMVDEVKNSYINVALNADTFNAEYLGMEEMAGKSYAVLKVDAANTVTFYLDPATSLPAYSKVSAFNPQMGKEVESVTAYSDWKTNNGVAYAYAHESKTDGTVTSSLKVDSVESN